jgi:hypothetical protein
MDWPLPSSMDIDNKYCTAKDKVISATIGSKKRQKQKQTG